MWLSRPGERVAVRWAMASPPTKAERAAVLAELLAGAVAGIAAPSAPALTPTGVPVGRGRIGLGRHRAHLHGGDLAVAAGFATACWVGRASASPPPLGRLVWRGATALDVRGRLTLPREARAYLAPASPAAFEVVVVAVDGGLLLIPTDGGARRRPAAGAGRGPVPCFRTVTMVAGSWSTSPGS